MLLAVILLFSTLCTGLEASEDTSDPPDAVKNLRAIQEGFQGLVSLTWDPPPMFPYSVADFYSINVTDSNNTSVEFTSEIEARQNIACVTVKDSEGGVTYILSVTPVRVDGQTNLTGPPTTAAITFQESGIAAPTGFEFAGRDIDQNLVKWEWVDDVIQHVNVWFFVRACQENDKSCCKHVTTTNKTAIVSYLSSTETYDVEIFAHANGVQAADPVMSSVPLTGKMATLPWDWPRPENATVVAEYETASLDQISYTAQWTILTNDRLNGITFDVYEGDNTNGPIVLTASTDAHGRELPLTLDYDTRYAIVGYAIYDLGLNQTTKSRTNVVFIHTIDGPSNPVRNFEAHQNDFTNRVTLTWYSPRKTHGDLKHYDVSVTSSDGTDVQSRERLSARQTETAKVTVKNAQFGPEYDFSITPVNVRADGQEILGQSATCTIILEEHRGFSPWAIFIIVAIVAALICGGAFYVLRSRRARHRTRCSDSNLPLSRRGF